MVHYPLALIVRSCFIRFSLRLSISITLFFFVTCRILHPIFKSFYDIFDTTITLMSASNSETNNHEQRIVLHVDMDSFFASVEIREKPELKDKPVVVGADPKRGTGRGVVSTCSYEARKYGIHSAMPVFKAYKLCPDCVFLPVHMELYKAVSEKVMSILRGFAEKFEQVSVDEAYLVPININNFDDAIICAHRIKEEIKQQERITCSVGICPNKLIAKIASGYQKPDGLAVVRPEDVRDFLYPLSVSKIPGIGTKTTEILKVMGINKIEELATFDVQLLTQRFGKMVLWMKQRANGIDFEEVEERDGVKSISRHITFDEDTDDPEKIAKCLDVLADSVHHNLTKNRLLFRTVTVIARLDDFTTYTRAKTVPVWTSDIDLIKRTAIELLSEFLGRKLRLVAVGVSKLRERDEKQMLITDFT
jgi:DNA polymerase IV (archaeal DinB-like DNA polymerase)